MTLIMSTVATSCGHYSVNQSITLSQEEKEARIRKEFNRNDSSIFAQLTQIYPSVTREEMSKWEESKALEYRIIDGKKMYFRNAARNVFRIDLTAKAIYDSITNRKPSKLDFFLADYIPNVVSEAKATGEELVKPETFKIRYTLSVKPDMVPDGEILRVWLPYLQNDPKYKDITLIATSQPDYQLSPKGSAHSSIYMEKTAKSGERTEFWYELSYTSYNQFFDFKPEEIKPYDKNSALYKEFTAERETHIIFSDRIKRITDSLTVGIDNPYLKVRNIWNWIADYYPWASAVEYSVLDNIPEYVLDNGHGDCGQVGLLFITMARYAGIPAKWQSGWMLHPCELNLHDWAQVYFEGVGWVGVDQSFGRVLTAKDLEKNSRRGYLIKGAESSLENEDAYYFFTKGMDAFRFIVNEDYSQEFYPAKKYSRSETVDFQRGEVEWSGGNLYFDCWNYSMEVL